jgi:hypothetical protein
MKQLSQLTTPQTTDVPSALNRRRLIGQVVLGGAAALVLTACGGGGGSDSSSDARDLVAAFDRLKFGMTWVEAVAAVGWEPNSTNHSWTHDSYLLNCFTEFDGDTQILASATLSSPRADSIFREYR